MICNDYASRLLFEVVWIAVIMAMLGVSIIYTIKGIRSSYELYEYVVTFALSGVILHLSCEFLGVNKWYILHSAATCK